MEGEHHHHEAIGRSGLRLGLRRVVGRLMTEAAYHSEDMTRTAELSCCGGVCPNCAPVMGLSLLSALGRRAAGRFRRKPEQSAQEIEAELLAKLPEGIMLPEGFVAAGMKQGIFPIKRDQYPYPTIVLSGGSTSGPDLSLDWRLSAPPESEAYQEALRNPKDGLNDRDREALQTMIDMGLPQFVD